eukprot:261976-Chlamydomonas_euryale.AAC.2
MGRAVWRGNADCDAACVAAARIAQLLRLRGYTAGEGAATCSSASATPPPASATPAPASATPAPASATPAPASATPSPASATPSPASATPAPASATPSSASATVFSRAIGSACHMYFPLAMQAGKYVRPATYIFLSRCRLADRFGLPRVFLTGLLKP